MSGFIPPQPVARPVRANPLTRLQLARKDLFSALPPHLCRAWMAEQWSPFGRTYLVNDPDLVREILQDRPRDFPKARIVGDTLKPLLGASVFSSNDEHWIRQRRIIDPAFEGGRVRQSFDAMAAAGRAAVARLRTLAADGPIEVEAHTAHLTADIIFRTLFSRPIEDDQAHQVYRAFRAYQRAQPVLDIPRLLQLPGWIAPHKGRKAATRIRELLRQMTDQRVREIAKGEAPDDLATKIMLTRDPQTQTRFSAEEMT